MAFAEAYFDDSTAETGERRLFIAGYLNTAEQWSLFADAWRECLNDHPKIEYLKMSEANALRGQFHGWPPEDRDAKLRRLSFIVQHFKPISFECSVSRQVYDDELADFAPRGLNPHFYAVFGSISGVARFLHSRGARTPVKFYFDEQKGVDLDIAIFFDYMRNQIPKGAKELISGLPSFENDKDLVPLQAADFLTWHLRRENEGRAIAGNLLDQLRGEHVVTEISNDIIRLWAREFGNTPGLDRMQSKGEWQRTRKAVADAHSRGYVPPYGTRWRNFWGRLRDKFNDRFFR